MFNEDSGNLVHNNEFDSVVELSRKKNINYKNLFIYFRYLINIMILINNFINIIILYF